MYRFDPTISSVIEEAAPPRPALSPEEPSEGPLSVEQLAGIHRYWQAANYLTVGQIYLQDNPLLRKPLEPEHIKPRLLGHWGTSPGLSFIYAHLNRLIREHDLDAIFLAGPGHGGPAVLVNVYLEGTYSEVYPDVSQDAAGMRRLFRQFSTPGGVPSHVSVPTPGSINEGGELGYVLSHAFGAAFDNPDLLVVAVIGDGEAETGPLAGYSPAYAEGLDRSERVAQPTRRGHLPFPPGAAVERSVRPGAARDAGGMVALLPPRRVVRRGGSPDPR